MQKDGRIIKTNYRERRIEMKLIDLIEEEINRTRDPKKRNALLEMHFFLTKNSSENFRDIDMLKRLTLFQQSCFSIDSENNRFKVACANQIKDKYKKKK